MTPREWRNLRVITMGTGRWTTGCFSSSKWYTERNSQPVALQNPMSLFS
jgi:hypothetical protein